MLHVPRDSLTPSGVPMASTILHLRQTESIWGPDRHIIQLARALPQAGYAVDVAVLDPSWGEASGRRTHWSRRPSHHRPVRRPCRQAGPSLPGLVAGS